MWDYAILYPFLVLFYLYVYWFRPPSKQPHASTQSLEFTHLKDEQLTNAVSYESGSPVFHWGRYTQPIINPNIVVTGNLLTDLRLKRYHFLSVTTDTHFVAVSVINAGYVTNAFCYVFTPSRTFKKLQEFRTTIPLALGVTSSPSSCYGVTEWKFRRNHIKITSTETKFEVEVHVVSRNGPQLSGNITMQKSKESLALLYPLEREPSILPRPAYTHKAAGMKASGTFYCDGQVINLDGGLGGSDWTKTIARRRTHWLWGYFAAHVTCQGVVRDVGINLSSQLFEDTQNVVFVDGKVYAQTAITMTYKGKNEITMKSDDGMVDLIFTRIENKEEHTNAIIISSSFVQGLGRYNGTIQLQEEGAERMTLKIVQCIGVFEDHKALW